MREVEDLQIVSDHEVVVSARFPVDDLKEALDLEVPDVEADTVGGLVYERLGEIPKVGATMQLGTATLTVESIRRQGIQTVRITSPTALVRDRGTRPGDHDGQQETRDTEEESPAHARRQ
jgi:CBS domain containing-hemolysin-like protein